MQAPKVDHSKDHAFKTFHSPPVFIILILLIVVTPWLFGGVLLSTQVVIFASTAVMVGMAAGRSWRDGSGLHVTWIERILLATILLGAVQLVPLPRGIHAMVAPELTATRAEMDPTFGPSDWRALTLDAVSTRSHLALLLLASSVLATSLRFGRRADWRRTTLLVLAAGLATGASLAMFGIIQQLTWNGMLYWIVPIGGDGGNDIAFASMNRNNAGGFLNLSLCCGLGLLFWGRRESESLARWFAQLDARQIYILAGIVCVLAGIVASLSRGAFLASAVSVSVAAILSLGRGQRTQGWLIAGVAVVGIAATIWLGRFESLTSRFEGVTSEVGSGGGRVVNWADAMHAVPESIWLGHGLDTYRFAYPRFQSAYQHERWHEYAENLFVQTLVDAGVVGLGLLIGAIGLALVQIWPLVRSRGAESAAIGIAGFAAMAGQVCSASFDFGIYFPSHLILLATLLGLCLARCESKKEGGAVKPEGAATTRTVWLACLAMGLSFASLDAARNWRVQRAMDGATLADVAGMRQLDELSDRMGRLRQTLRWSADHAVAHHRFAAMQMQAIRLRYANEIAAAESWLNAEQLWERSTWERMCRDVRDPACAAMVQEFLTSEAVRGQLDSARNHARLGRRSSPFWPRNHLTLGQLAAVEESDISVDFKRAKALGPMESSIWYWAGVYTAVQGNGMQAVEDWQRTLSISTRFDGEIVRKMTEFATLNWEGLYRDDAVVACRIAERLKRAGEMARSREVAERGLQLAVEEGMTVTAAVRAKLEVLVGP